MGLENRIQILCVKYLDYHSSTFMTWPIMHKLAFPMLCRTPLKVNS